MGIYSFFFLVSRPGCRTTEVVVKKCSAKKVFLKISQNSQESTYDRVSFLTKLKAWGLQLYLKKTLTQVFSCEYCEISKSTFFHRTPFAASRTKTIGLLKEGRVHMYILRILQYIEVASNVPEVYKREIIFTLSKLEPHSRLYSCVYWFCVFQSIYFCTDHLLFASYPRV